MNNSDFLSFNDSSATILKKNARILFNSDDNGIITDLIVEDFENPLEKQYLYEKYRKDIGNCLSRWNDWNLEDVLIRIFFVYTVPFTLRKEIITELSKVIEWNEILHRWNYNDKGEG